MHEVSLIIPTLDAEPHLPALRQALDAQRRPPDEVVVIDSSSADGTADLCRRYDWRVHVIDRRDFDHGGTRNLGASLARGSVLAFMTQDALPADEEWLEALVAPVASGEAAAAFSRQLPRPDATVLERYARLHNYPDVSHVRTLEDAGRLGVRATFFSNVSSATDRAAFESVGGFPARTIINEDGQYAARLLAAGHRVAYVAGSRVVHSHDYPLSLQFRRNFDIGVSHAQADGLLRGVSTTSAGLSFVRGQLAYALAEGSPADALRVLLEAATKFTAFHLGRRYELLPLPLRRRMSWHRGFWSSPEA